MIIPERTEKEIEQGRKFIGLVGSKRILKLSGFSAQALSGWRKRGIPTAWLLALKARYPSEFKQAFLETNEGK